MAAAIGLSPGNSNEIGTVTKNDITIFGSSSSQGIKLVIGDGVSGLVLSGDAPIKAHSFQRRRHGFRQ
jgi:hypothetical protein